MSNKMYLTDEQIDLLKNAGMSNDEISKLMIDYAKEEFPFLKAPSERAAIELGIYLTELSNEKNDEKRRDMFARFLRLPRSEDMYIAFEKCSINMLEHKFKNSSGLTPNIQCLIDAIFEEMTDNELKMLVYRLMFKLMLVIPEVPIMPHFLDAMYSFISEYDIVDTNKLENIDKRRIEKNEGIIEKTFGTDELEKLKKRHNIK